MLFIDDSQVENAMQFLHCSKIAVPGKLLSNKTRTLRELNFSVNVGMRLLAQSVFELCIFSPVLFVQSQKMYSHFQNVIATVVKVTFFLHLILN